MQDDLSNTFPLSKTKVLRGNRRIAREKVLQTLFAYHKSGTDIDILFEHIFSRDFNFGDEELPLLKDKILRPDEVWEIEADIPINWGEAEKQFASKLLSSTIKTAPLIDEKMKTTSSNWDLDRITLIDLILIQMACTEFVNFEDIPPKVSINEAIDIAKKYSTDKSGNFINGILDAMLVSLTSEGLVIKTGRGLKEKKDNESKDKKKNRESKNKKSSSELKDEKM
ncbi:MAG: transcription antitermination factor NusB [Candidatus Kapabacteria bacterium]|nr:transcription antitermination factor NusB [Candidatus Kapabacteria bacterium]